jgi:hypothetical protein
MEVQQDCEIMALLTPLSTEAYAILDGKLAAEGCCEEFPYAMINGVAIQLDGHHRRRICGERKIDYGWRLIKTATTKEEAISWVKANQIGRRNATPEELAQLRAERRERVVAARERGESTRDIAASEGVTHTTVQQDLQAAVESPTEAVGNQFPTAEVANGSDPVDGKVHARDGKKYTARKPKPKRAPKRKPQGFDLKSWESHVGYVVRGLDDLNRLCGEHETPQMAGCQRRIAEVRKKLEDVLAVGSNVAMTLKEAKR